MIRFYYEYAAWSVNTDNGNGVIITEMSQLRYFLEAARLQHMTKAAAKLHIAQPALTQAIHRLEAELEVPLFVPRGRGVVLTEYGMFLKERAQDILQSVDALRDEVSSMSAQENSIIRMNVLAASYIVTESVIAYKQSKNHINFQLGQDEDGLCDISISTKLFFQRPVCSEQYVFTERIFLAVPVSGHYGARKSIRLEDMRAEEFIALAGSRQFRLICDKLCAHAGFEPHVVFQSDNPTAVKNLIAAGVGVGFWPEYSWGELNNPDVALLEIEEPVCRRDIIISRYDNKADNTEVIRYYNFMVDFFKRLKGE